MASRKVHLVNNPRGSCLITISIWMGSWIAIITTVCAMGALAGNVLAMFASIWLPLLALIAFVLTLLGWGGIGETNFRRAAALTLSLVAFLGSSGGILTVSRVRESRARNELLLACQGNLRAIHSALYLYAAAHEGEFPSGDAAPAQLLMRLLKPPNAPIKNPQTLICPGRQRGVYKYMYNDRMTEAFVGYEYVTGLGAADSGDLIIAFDDSPENHGGGRNVLFLDGDVTWLAEEAFQERMTRQRRPPEEPSASAAPPAGR